ncbi:MAG TPA: hypothetical protein VIN34_09795 [Candidatus Limnocylindria bacterium]
MARPRRFGALVLAFLVAGCSAQVAAPRPSATPVATPGMSETPRPTNASTDVIYLRLNGGPSATILAIDARTGQTLRTMRDGAVTADGAAVYWQESVGGTTTAIHLTDLASGRELRSFTVEGDLRPAGDPASFSPLAGDGRLTGDGHHLALMNTPYKLDGDWVTKLVVVNTETGAIESSAEFRGQRTYGFVTFAPDGRSLFLEQYGDGATRTRAFDIASGTLVDPSGEGLVTTGFRTAAVLSADRRWLFRLDAGSPTTNCTSTDGPACTPNSRPPYLVALDLATRRATQLTLPAAQASGEFEQYMLWSLAIAPDGSTLYAANPALGVIDEIDARTMSLRRTAAISVARRGGDLLTTVGQLFFGIADAKRYLIGGATLSPDGRTLYAAARDGLAVIDTASLGARTVWQKAHQFDTLRLSSDGRRLYAMDNSAGRLVMIDASTGASFGEVKLQYVPAILRIESGR